MNPTKQERRKLKLKPETLQHLAVDTLEQVQGGAGDNISVRVCTILTCPCPPDLTR